MNLIDDLQKIKDKKILVKDIKKRIKNYYLLLSKRMIKKVKCEEEVDNIPDGLPRWVSKYKFLKKKYGVKSEKSVEEFVALTDKGKRELERLKKKVKNKKKEESEIEDETINSKKP